MTQVRLIEDAETQIRILVRDWWFNQSSKLVLDKKVKAVIKECVNALNLRVLKDMTAKSLVIFYNEQVAKIRQIKTNTLLLFLALKDLKAHTNVSKALNVINKNKLTYGGGKVYDLGGYGVPLQRFMKDYVKENIIPTMKDLANQQAKDLDDASFRNSLRNKAEMEVRYQDHLDQIAKLKEQTDLVIASTHVDCSERCRKWQGRVYSLNGTSGTSDDGRKYVPLEEATHSEQVKYVTKKGKVYYNGLLGFNCRHYLVPYKSGLRFGKASEEREKLEYDITLKQREFERRIRQEKIKAIYAVDNKAKELAVKNYTQLTKEYKEYSRKNKRAYYPSRITII